VSIDNNSEWNEPALGKHNANPKPEYMPMINEWAKASPDPNIKFVAEDEYPPNQIGLWLMEIATPVWDMRISEGPEYEEWANKQDDMTKLLEGSKAGYGCGQIWVNKKAAQGFD